MSAHRPIRTIPLAVLLLAVLWAPPALAGEFTKTGEFGGPGSGPGQFAGESPLSIAAEDSTGDIYAFDDGPNLRVQRFDASGGFLSQLEAPPTPFIAGDLGMAVDNSSGPSKGNVYVADTEHGVIDRFNAEGAYLGQLTGLSSPTGVTVDSEGDVYVAQLGGSRAVAEFDREGNLLGERPIAALSAPFGIAIDSKHHLLYVVNLFSNVVRVTLNAEGEVRPGSEVVIDSHQSTAVAVDTSTGDVYVLDAEGGPHVVAYEPDAEQLAEFGAGQIGFSLGLAFNAFNKHVYVADDANNRVGIYSEFEPAGPLPLPVAEPPSELKPKTASFNGTLNPQALKTSYHFQYGPCTAPAECASSPFPLNTPEETAGEKGEATPLPVSASVTELQPGRAYHLRLLASNENGTLKSEEVQFTTPAAVEASSCEPSEITAFSARLNGTVNPDGAETTVLFQYVIDSAYDPTAEDPYHAGSTAPTPALELSGTEPIPVAATVEGLEPNRTYHCRLTGTNQNGSGFSAEDRVFKTALATPALSAEASVTSRKTAILTGTVNPENSASKYHFEYVADAAYVKGATNPYAAGARTPEAGVGEGFEAQDAGPVQINGLWAGTTYHYRIVASNEGGTSASPDQQFTTAARTPPLVGAAEVTALTPTSAAISETIDPRGLPTAYELEIGTEAGGHLSYIPWFFGQVVEGHGQVTQSLEDLAPGTTYHYRIVATNEDGSTEGADQTFTTLGFSSSIIQPPTLALLAIPAVAFPTETGKVTHVVPLTRAQKLAAALKACRKKRNRAQRAACQRRARRRYGPLKKKR